MITVLHFINSIQLGGAEKMLLLEINNCKKFHHKILLLNHKKSDFIKNFEKLEIMKLNFNTIKYLNKNKKEIIIKSYLYRSHIFSIIFYLLNFKIIWSYHSARNSLSLVSSICLLLSHFIPDKQIFVSRFAMNSHLKFGFSKKNTTVIYNSIMRNAIYSAITYSHKKNIIIGMVSRYNKIKNFDLCFKIFKNFQTKFPNSYLHLIGSNCELSNKSLVKKLKKYSIFEKTLLRGELLDEKEIYKNFSLIVSTSSSESFGLSLIEAGYFKIPIASINLEVLEEILPIENANSYSNDIKKNVDHWMNQIKKSKKSLNYISKYIVLNYNLDNFIKQNSDVYFSLLNEK